MSTLAEVRARVKRIANLAAEAQRRPDKASACLDVIESIARDEILAALPADGVIVTAESLAAALHAVEAHRTPSVIFPHPSWDRRAAAILAALAAEGGET